MTVELILLMVIILVALVLFVSAAVRVDLTAILVMVALMATGILSPEEAVSGFSNLATITILALLIISEGLRTTGAVEELGDHMVRISSKNEPLTIFIIMVISAVTSAFINNTAIVAVFIPVMFRIAEATGLRVAVLLIPLSFASMVGGASTMIGTSTNLLINSMAKDHQLEAFQLFQPMVMGLILLGAALIYMAFAGRFMLRKRPKEIEVFDRKTEKKIYITEITVPGDSELIGKPLHSTDLGDEDDFEIIRVILAHGNEVQPADVRELQEGDTITVKTDVKQIVKLNENHDWRIKTNMLKRNRGVQKNEQEEELFEVLIADNSELMDQHIEDINFLSYYDAYPLAVKKQRPLTREQLMKHRINYGDILLMSGKSHQEDKMAKNLWITVQQFSRAQIKTQLPNRDKMGLSIVITLGVILLAVFNIMPIIISAWIGVGLMFLTGCLTLKNAYDNIEWKVIFLLAGVIPLGTALSKTGGDGLIAGFILRFAEGASLTAMVSILFFITVVLTGIISNQATAVLLVPIAIQLASSMNLPAEPLLMTILFGASTSFLTPVGYQTNAMILGPGNYTFNDFLKVGGLLCLLFWALCTFLIPVIYG